MRRLSFLAIGFAAFFFSATLATGTALTNSTELSYRSGADEARMLQIQQQLHPVGGDVAVPGANAVLHLGRDYYFLPASEARLVLTEGWGNPPGVADGVLGLVLPAGTSFMDDTWGATITYEAIGHVSDGDAASIDDGALLAALRDNEATVNAEGTAQGYPATHLVGWAQRPAYDRRTHVVTWARDVQFADDPENTLNYDIRLLGRRGVLGVNFITDMSKLAETQQAGQRLAAAAEFAPGARYADFRPSVDRAAEYGIAGMIAASVGATLPAKTGLSVLILPSLISVLLAGILLGWRRLTGPSDSRAMPRAIYRDPARPPRG